MLAAGGTVMDMLLLAGTRILEPHLRHTFAQSRDGSDALQILPIGIAIYLKIRLQHLQLFFGKCCSNALRFAFVVAVGIAAICKTREQRELSIRHL